MSHEGIRAFIDDRDRKKQFRDEARRNLYDEGEIGFWGTTEGFWKQEHKIQARAIELEERAEYKRLKKKYG